MYTPTVCLPVYAYHAIVHPAQAVIAVLSIGFLLIAYLKPDYDIIATNGPFLLGSSLSVADEKFLVCNVYSNRPTRIGPSMMSDQGKRFRHIYSSLVIQRKLTKNENVSEVSIEGGIFLLYSIIMRYRYVPVLVCLLYIHI